MRPDEAGTVRGTVYDLARRWSYSTDTGHASALARLSDDDIREAWGTKEVRVVVTPSGKRILRDERNYDIATFDDLNKAEFEQFAPDALKAKAKDMELILKAAVASDGEKTEFASAYEAFRTAIGKYSAAHRNDAEIETAMTTAASSLDSQFGFMSRNVADLVIPGSLHRVQDILAQTDSSARRRMSYEWARNVSHDTLRQTILNDRFEKLTGTLGAQINDEDLNTVQQILGNFSDTAVGQFEAGINNPSSVSDPTQRAVYEKFHAILVSGLTSQSAREQSIKKFTLNIRRKIVDGGGEAKKYLENHARANHDAVVKQVLENTDIDVNPILATGGKTDKERDALERYRRAMGAVQSHVTAIFAITAVKTGIFDAAVEAAVRTDVLKNDPDTELYGDIMGKRGWSDWSDSTTSNAVNTLAFVLPEVIGMAAGIGIGYGVMRGVSWGISAANGARYARIAAASGRAGKALRMAEFGIEGVTYGTSLYMAGLAIPNLLHGRDWNEGFDRKELFFSMGLGAFYPAIHALSPMGKLVTGQGLLGKSMRFAGNTLFDTGVVMAGGWLVDISFGKGEWFEKDFWEVLAMMPLMRVGMNLSAGSRNSFLFKKDASGNIVTTMTDTRFAPAMDELTQSIRVLDRAPTGTPMEFPGSTVKKLPNGNFEVTPTASSGAVGQAVSPDQLMATIKQYAPELTPAHHAAMASRRADMELSRLMADNVPLPGGQRVTLENPAAPAADYRYTVKDSSGHVIATGVERSKLSGFVTQLNDATAAAHPTTGLLAQLRAGVPEVGDATAIRVVVKNPEAAEAARLCEIYHKNIKIADNLSINQVDTHLGSIFAAVDDANATRMITELQGTPAKLTNVEGSLQATMYGTPTSGPRYQIKQ